MQLYFLRHGEADWPGWTKPDDERPLTDFGKKEVGQVAKFLDRLKVKPDLNCKQSIAASLADGRGCGRTAQDKVAPGRSA